MTTGHDQSGRRESQRDGENTCSSDGRGGDMAQAQAYLTLVGCASVASLIEVLLTIVGSRIAVLG